MDPSFGREKTSYQLFWQDSTVSLEFRSGVSLHSHSMYSEENLEMLPRYVGTVPIVHRLLNDSIDYRRAYWTPPLSPKQSYLLEEGQINERFRLPALVSITDHDDGRAGSMLRVLPHSQLAPLSVEWTVPFGPTFFHLGVHNLRAASFSGMMSKLHHFTAHPKQDQLVPLLDEINSDEEVLLVLNHPLWDEKQIGISSHREALASLLRLVGGKVHALEVNGFRPWSENREVMSLGVITGHPIVSGGDRHGCEPNAILNLTHGLTFPDFVYEIRSLRRSHVVFMPQFNDCLRWRTMQTTVDVLKDYSGDCEGRRRWIDRVFYRQPSGEAMSMSAIWPQGDHPKSFSAVSKAVHLAQSRSVQSALKALFSLHAPGGLAI